MTLDEAIAELSGHAQPGRAEEMLAYHKVPRAYLGVSNVDIDVAVRNWRTTLSLSDRLTLATGLWDTDVHEARVAAAKLLLQARIRPDDSDVWALITTWVSQFDAWAIADHVSIAGQKRLVADPKRLDVVEEWTKSNDMWTRRAALVMTLPWARMRNPKPQDLERRDRVLGWAATYVNDPEWFIQKAVAWWLRDHSRHDPQAIRAFLDEHGKAMRAFARKEAAKHLPRTP